MSIKFLLTIEVVDESKPHRITFVSIARSVEEILEVQDEQYKCVVNHLWVPEDA